jgi:hypothetical protein
MIRAQKDAPIETVLGIRKSAENQSDYVSLRVVSSCPSPRTRELKLVRAISDRILRSLVLPAMLQVKRG